MVKIVVVPTYYPYRLHHLPREVTVSGETPGGPHGN